MSGRTWRKLQVFTAVALISIAPVARAQNKSASTKPVGARTGKAQIVGVAVDSLNGGYLSGASVVIDGSAVTLETDSLGSFRIDSLPPGTYQVGVFHPILDTLGITLLTQPFHVGPDSSGFVLLAVPSAATIIRRSCPPQSGVQGKSVVMGHVEDPETLQPVARAEVFVAWEEIEVSKQFGIRRFSRLVRDSTNNLGAFRICGLPSDLEATLQARRGSAVTAEIPISLGEKPAGVFARTILLSLADSGTKAGNAAVSGKVVLEGSLTSGAGSRVELVGTDIVAMTNDAGEFTMRNLPSGTKALLARHLGFGAGTVPVDLSSREQKRVTIKLPKFVAMMDPVLITARRSAALDKVGFTRRRQSGMGYYIGPDRLEKAHPFQLTDIFRQVPGLRVSYSPEGDVVSSSREAMSGCVRYYVDGMPFQEAGPGEINHFVSGGEVVAVEVYQAVATPGEFMGARGCTTIVLWTRFKIRG